MGQVKAAGSVRGDKVGDYLAMVVMVLMCIGTVFVFSAASNIIQEPDLRRFYAFSGLRQVLFFPLAVAVMYAMSCLDYHRFSLDAGWLRSPVSYLFVLSVVLLVVVLMPQFGTEVNEARRWLRVELGAAELSFQPSELAKWTVVFLIAAFCARFAGQMGDYRRRFLPACLLVAVPVGLIISEDLGTAAFICLLGFLLLVIGQVKWGHILSFVPAGVAAFVGFLLYSPGRLQRIQAFVDPGRWADSAAYQANQSLIALGSGGLPGRGLGRGICKYGYLPEDTTDFVFAIIGEELGLVGALAVIGLFMVFVWLGIVVVVRCRDRFGRLLAGGIVLTIGIQAAINIGVVTVVLPTKGIPLPFVSAGGTSMLLSAAAVGVLVNIARQSGTEPLGDRQ